MRSGRWSLTTILKYTLFQLPEIAVVSVVLIFLGKWEVISASAAYGLIAVWIIKDVLLYPFLWKAYEFGGPKKANPMIGQVGFVKNRLGPTGMISVRGELWKARIAEDAHPIEIGRHVRVVSIDGLTLVVEPE